MVRREATPKVQLDEDRAEHLAADPERAAALQAPELEPFAASFVEDGVGGGGEANIVRRGGKGGKGGNRMDKHGMARAAPGRGAALPAGEASTAASGASAAAGEARTEAAEQCAGPQSRPCTTRP